MFPGHLHPVNEEILPNYTRPVYYNQNVAVPVYILKITLNS